MSLNQTDIFSMFNIEDEVETKKIEAAKAAEEAKAKQIERINAMKGNAENNGKTGMKPSVTEKKDPFKVTVSTIIRYAGEERPVTSYFSIEQLENGLATKKKDSDEVEYKPISENDLRKKLEEDYPELVANFTSLVYIEKKDIVVPVLQAKKKGNNDCTEESPIILGDSFYTPSPKKKIPFQLLAEFLVIAKDFAKTFGTEVHADFYLDLDTDEFFMDIPKQRVNPVLVEITETPLESALKFIEKRYVKVMEIHSHHYMSATPSSIDDANERSQILYAIVGRLDRLFPEITLRTFDLATQRHIPLNPSLVFEEQDYQNDVRYIYDTSVVEVA
ncbi:hypothetical protein AWM68_17780 [Fictibacillus phosphorivorans]|uniref:JAB domain-containing protein n=1 Tax=Fictibacillus phosphorivorans TaxID=1221500 RepID=A0A165NX73_9BACL|nr:hypothetical protein [Fictibacillus phosphorivorans]KZE68020.1 hypothetical protein AWM68_17780 [Fictibacillus phosphorivorans]